MNNTPILEDDFYERLISYLIEKEINFRYGIIREPILSEYTSASVPIQWRPDFMILKGRYPYVVIEVVSSQSDNSDYTERFRSSNFRFDMELIGADYILIIDTTTVALINNNSQGFNVSSFPILALDDVFELLFDEGITDEEIADFKVKIAKTIKRIVAESDLPIRPETFLNNTKKFIENQELGNNIEYNANGRFFHFTSHSENGLNNFENLFFQTLLEPVTEEAVCRYTTLDTLYHTINNRSYRMASHIAMNDRGEVDYADKYVGAFYTPLLNMTLNEVKQLNRSYISSCTTIDKEDDLTMYRLYGDDSRGVCLRFNVTNGVQSNNLLVKKISYAASPGKHPELDIIKNIVNTLSGVYKLRFRFLYIDVWKHFFKSFDYAIEKEVRVLYLDASATNPRPTSSGWVIAQPDRIVSKYVTFSLSDLQFPLKLSKIILGPNCPERAVNKRQFEVWLDEISMAHVQVENSKIESYRKS
ncbi:DUF2971 domain-containing protein [Chitinophagaceae bacterium MMS25-I14]